MNCCEKMNFNALFQTQILNEKYKFAVKQNVIFTLVNIKNSKF